MNEANATGPATPQGAQTSIRSAIDEIDALLLLGSERRVRIHHRGQEYELRETRDGRLILRR